MRNNMLRTHIFIGLLISFDWYAARGETPATAAHART
jgi:hypothetical protein